MMLKPSSRSSRNFLAIIALFTLLFAGSTLKSARAQILLKPKGQNAAPLRIKSLDAQVRLNGQFAQSVLTYVFQNETAERIEADFLYTVPAHATVTYFAYWFGKEKVIARVVEKERAAQIYGYITSRMRDPALIEMVGKNTFRARIFPVMPNADLKIEIHTVQVLPSTPQGAVYTLPLRGPEKGKGTFEQLNVNIQGTLDGAFSSVGNNFQQPMQINGDNFRYQLQQKQYLAPRDLQIVLKPHAKPLRAVLYGAKSGGGDGFFALALSPQSALKKPRLTLSGVKTYDLAPRILPSVVVGGTLLVTGRYKGSGPVNIVLSDSSRRQQNFVVFPNQVVANNLAAKLWAARRIDDLSSNQKNREAVIALSQRHTLPSKWTSWLAIPTEELERYKQEKAQADMDYYGRLLAVEIAHSRGKGKRAKELRTRFEAAARLAGKNDGQSLQNWAASRLNNLSYDYEYTTGKTRRQMRAEMRGLARMAGVNVKLYFNRAHLDAERERLYEARNRQMSSLSQQLALELMRKGDTKRAKALNSQLTRVARLQGEWRGRHLYDLLNDKTNKLSDELIQQRLAEKPDAVRMARLEGRLKLLSRYSDTSLENLTNEAESRAFSSSIHAEARELIELRHADTPNRARLGELEKKFARYKNRIKIGEQALLSVHLGWLREQMHTSTTLLTEERLKPSPDTARVKALSTKVEKTLDELVATMPHALHRENVLARHNDLATINAANRALNSMIQALQLEQTKRKAQLSEARSIYNNAHKKFRGPAEANLLETDLKESLDTAENQQGPLSPDLKGTLSRQFQQMVRWGDPLISIEAPADARQVIALLPGGEIKRLIWNGTRWQARFDIPTHAPEGDFPITVVIVNRDGTRRTLKLHFKVDVTAPQGRGAAYRADDKLRLEASGDKDTTRVSALLPWNQKVLLAPSQTPHSFFALTDIPADWQGKAFQITYVLTDKAHNRTTVTVDLEK